MLATGVTINIKGDYNWAKGIIKGVLPCNEIQPVVLNRMATNKGAHTQFQSIYQAECFVALFAEKFFSLVPNNIDITK